MSDTVISYTFTFLITIMLDNFYIYSDFSMRCNRRTTRGYRLHRLSLLGYRFGRSGVVGLLVDFSVFVDGGDRGNRARALTSELEVPLELQFAYGL